jgi:hypothetical protein
MLTKKQLEDAVKCAENREICKHCSCNNYDGACLATGRAAKTALAYREMLERACVILNDHFCGDEHYAGIGELEEVRKVLNEWKEITS